MRHILLLLALVAVVEMPNPPKAPACAAAPRRGEFIDVNSEEAIIVYDAKTKTEHFIRRSNFRTQSSDFGFLVPTPTKPEIGETPSSVFMTLHSATAPRRVESGNVKRVVIKKNEPQSEARAGNAAPRGPEILGKGDAAGLAYVILRADDVDGLKKWLEDNKYDSRPELVEWLKWYVDNKWIITAFKVKPDPGSQNDRWFKSIRMSFETDKPFYPYREPEDMRTKAGGQRSLRVFYLGDSRVGGKIGANANWAGRTAWSNVLNESYVNTVVANLVINKDGVDKLKSQKWHLTEFEDNSAPRPGTDEVYFSISQDQSMVERPVIYYDKYEYVYEENNTVSTPAGEVDRSMLWLMLGGIVALVAIVVVVILLMLRKKRPGAGMD
jgi:hypothetical protein